MGAYGAQQVSKGYTEIRKHFQGSPIKELHELYNQDSLVEKFHKTNTFLQEH